jgi:hypothetical protein
LCASARRSTRIHDPDDDRPDDVRVATVHDIEQAARVAPEHDGPAERAVCVLELHGSVAAVAGLQKRPASGPVPVRGDLMETQVRGGTIALKIWIAGRRSAA